MNASQSSDLVGKKFGLLVVVRMDRRDGKSRYWKCRCECGKEVITRTGSLTGGHAKSCGHTRYEKMSAKFSAPVTNGRKECTQCGLMRPLTDFRDGGPFAKRASCMKCDAARERQRYASDPSAISKRIGEWRRRTNYAAQSSQKLSDWYVRGVIAHAEQIPASSIPAPLIKAKRAHLKVQRELKERMK
jgi:hypothetical protein